MMKPKIGEPRLYEVSPFLLYPGEQASAEVDLRCGEGTFMVTHWIVEPMPGVYGWMLRMRYRLVDQWIERWRR